MKRNPIVNTILLMALCFAACKKSPVGSNDPKNQALIQSAKTYFETHQQNATASPNGNNRTMAAKYPDWPDAYCITSTTGTLVVVPVFYEKDLVIQTTFSGNHLLSLNSLTNLVKILTKMPPSYFYYKNRGDMRVAILSRSPIFVSSNPKKPFKIQNRPSSIR